MTDDRVLASVADYARVYVPPQHDHVLAPSTVPGYAVVCIVEGCGRLWVRGPVSR